MSVAIGKKLAKLRKDRKLSIREVSLAIDKSATMVKAYEAGTSFPPINILMRLMSLYRASCDELFGLNDKKKITINGFSNKEADFIFEIDYLFALLLKEKRENE